MVIARAGASTVAELACAGRPAIFVPYPSAMDDHQTWNVVDLVQAGGAISFQQPTFTPAGFARHIQCMPLEPGADEDAATSPASCGLRHTPADLAALVESLRAQPLR